MKLTFVFFWCWILMEIHFFRSVLKQYNFSTLIIRYSILFILRDYFEPGWKAASTSSSPWPTLWPLLPSIRACPRSVPLSWTSVFRFGYAWTRVSLITFSFRVFIGLLGLFHEIGSLFTLPIKCFFGQMSHFLMLSWTPKLFSYYNLCYDFR